LDERVNNEVGNRFVFIPHATRFLWQLIGICTALPSSVAFSTVHGLLRVEISVSRFFAIPIHDVSSFA